MRTIQWMWMACLFAAGALVANQHDVSLQVRNAWIRDAPPSAQMRSGYAILQNGGSKEIEIVSASSPDFGLVEMHETRVENDIARMVELHSVRIAARSNFHFKPGGAHFMLMQSKREMRKGESTTITLTLKSGENVVANFVVGAPL